MLQNEIGLIKIVNAPLNLKITKLGKLYTVVGKRLGSSLSPCYVICITLYVCLFVLHRKHSKWHLPPSLHNFSSICVHPASIAQKGYKHTATGHLMGLNAMSEGLQIEVQGV